MQIRFENRQPLRVAYVRHVGPYQECDVAWKTLSKFAEEHGFSPNALRIGIGHDNPDVTPAEKLRYDACLTVDEQFQPTGPVGVQEIPGGEYAITTHRGSYSGLADVYRHLFHEWLPASGRKLRSAPCFEIYVTDPRTTPQKESVTEICIPLEG